MAKNLRSALNVIISDAADLRWLGTKRVEAAYLGWLGRGNIGDEEMFRSFQSSWGTEVRKVPLTSLGRAVAFRSEAELLVVGGGTLLGRPEWNVRIEEAIRVLRPKVLVTAGTGVVQPGSEIAKHAALPALEKTAQILKDFDHVTVRGPRSAAILSEFGIESTAIGDLALIDPSKNIHSRSTLARNKLILVNLVKENTPGSTLSHRGLTTLRIALQELSASGYTVQFFSMEKGDEHFARRHFGSDFEVIGYDRTRNSLDELARSAALVISERLHGSILAARVGTPFLAMAYMSKVRDFAESINSAHRIVGLDDFFSPATFKAKAEAILSSGPRDDQVEDSVNERARDIDEFIQGLGNRDRRG